MVRQPLKVKDLHAEGGEVVQKLRLGGPGIAVQHDDGRGGWCLKRPDHQLAPGFVAALHKLHPPADLRQDRGEGPGPLPATPAIDQRPPSAGHFGQRVFQMPRGVSRHQRGADLAGEEGGLLLVDGADPRPLCIVEDGQVDRTRQVILGEFRRGTHVDHRVEAKRQGIGHGGQGQGHAPSLTARAAGRKGA